MRKNTTWVHRPGLELLTFRFQVQRTKPLSHHRHMRLPVKKVWIINPRLQSTSNKKTRGCRSSHGVTLPTSRTSSLTTFMMSAAVSPLVKASVPAMPSLKRSSKVKTAESRNWKNTRADYKDDYHALRGNTEDNSRCMPCFGVC